MPRVAATGATERDMVGNLARLGYPKARRLLIGAGLAVLAVLVVGLLARSVDHVEVIGTLLFVPVFLAFMYFGVAGGAVAGVAAVVAYVVLRLDAIEAVGFGEFAGTVITRSLGYLLFGVAGGWASATLAESLDKLDLYDQIDDDTGVHNARFLISDVGLEQARSDRYQTVFSVAFAEFPSVEIDALGGRRRRALLRELGSRLEAGIRTIDRVAHATDGRRHHVAVVLPETAAEGVAVFQARLESALRTFLEAHDLDVPVTGEACTVPGSEDAVQRRLEHWRAIDSLEHEAHLDA